MIQLLKLTVAVKSGYGFQVVSNLCYTIGASNVWRVYSRG